MGDLEGKKPGATCHAVGESGMEDVVEGATMMPMLTEEHAQEALLGVLKGCTAHEVDEVLETLRAQQGEWTVPSMTNFACEILLLLQQRCVKDQLKMGSLRRLTSLASEAFVEGLMKATGLANAAGQLLASCIAVAPAVESYRMDNFQIFLEHFQQKAPKITTQAAGSVFAATLTKAVSAFCAASSPPSEAAGGDAAKTAARLSMVAVLSPALKQREGSMRCFVEDMAAYLAEAFLEVDAYSEAAKLLLVSLTGGIFLVLRCRKASCDSKVACLKIIGRITQRLNAKNVEEVLCQNCQDLQKNCPACQDPTASATSEHHCRKGRVEAAFYEDSCDLCLLRWAASEMQNQRERSAKGASVDQELWPARYLLLESWKEQKSVEADLLRDAGRWLKVTLWAEEKLPAGAKEVLKRGRACLTGSKTAKLKVSQSWSPPEEALCRPLRRQQHRGAVLLMRNLTTAVMAQLRSPQAHVRSAALRALLPVAKGEHLHELPIPKSILEELLRKDPSAWVRAAAIPLISALGQDGNGTWDSWSLGLLRAAAAREDDAPTVRLGSCRFLATALRHSVGTAMGNVAEICCEVAVHMNALWSHASAGGIVDDMQHFIFDHVESEGHVAMLLEALSSAYRLGAEELLPVTLKAFKKREAKYQCKVQALAAALRDAFGRAPAVSGAALEALSVAAPWALVDHVKALSSYLAMDIPPSADEEVRGLSILAVLGNALAEGKTPIRTGSVLSPWAWARLHELCASQSSKLVRAAMRCVCLAARVEENNAPILRHLRTALPVLRTQPDQAASASSGGILRAAWLAACACEFCDLDEISPSELGLQAMPTLSRKTRLGVGTGIAKDLLHVFQVFQAAEVHSALPALVMAVGFALRRHWHLVGSTEFDQVISAGLAETGDALLAERSLEVLASLCEHLTRRAEEGEAGNFAVVMSKLTRHLPAVLRFLRHGLQRRAGPGDAGLRGHAMRAIRALHRAGLGGNPAVLCAAAMTSIFDPSLQPAAPMLLMSLAQKDSQALAQAQSVGLRKAFSALLWQAPQKLALSSKNPALMRAASSVGKSFAVCGRLARGKWLRLVLQELTSNFVESNYEALPEQLAPSRRLSAFGGSPVKDWTDQWPRLARLQLLYSHFLGQILCALPLSIVAPTTGQSEMELVKEECRKFLDLRCAVAASALEHEGSLSVVTATCIISMIIKALLVSLPHAEHLERLGTFAAELVLHRDMLDKVAKGDKTSTEQWLQDAQGTTVTTKSTFKSPKKRRAPVRGRIEGSKKQRRNADGKAS